MLVDFYRSLERRKGLTPWRCGISGLKLLLYHRCSALPCRCVCVRLKHLTSTHIDESGCLHESCNACGCPCVCVCVCVCVCATMSLYLPACADEAPVTGNHSGTANTEQSRARDDIYDLSHSATCFPKRRPFKCHICSGASPNLPTVKTQKNTGIQQSQNTSNTRHKYINIY